jgi:hypothetical protein
MEVVRLDDRRGGRLTEQSFFCCRLRLTNVLVCAVRDFGSPTPPNSVDAELARAEVAVSRTQIRRHAKNCDGFENLL